MQNKYQSFIYYYMAALEYTDKVCEGECYSLTIQYVQFSDFNRDLHELGTLNYVEEEYGMRYQGKIVNLNDFKGVVDIQSTSFIGNRLYFDGSCNVLTGEGLDNKATSQYAPIF